MGRWNTGTLSCWPDSSTSGPLSTILITTLITRTHIPSSGADFTVVSGFIITITVTGAEEASVAEGEDTGKL